MSFVMLVILLGAIVTFTMVHEIAIVEDRKQGDIVYSQNINESFREDVVVRVEPLKSKQFRNVVRQAYDYSCGSAALTTILDYYLGRNFQERQVMEGLLQFGETERIIQRRGFSFLDMKRLVTALGHPSGGFKAELSDLIELKHPAIAPIEYAGFKHFVVIKAVVDGHVFVADPALGNISFTLRRFSEIWDNNTLFIVFPGDVKPVSELQLSNQDMRIVSDMTLAQNAFKEFPHFSLHNKGVIDNRIAQFANNAKSSFVPKLDSNGQVMKFNGEIVYENKIETNVPDSEYNVIETSDSTFKINKTLRFRPK